MNSVDMTGPDRPTSGKPLKILAVHRYYWPDTPPYAAMLRRIVKQWVGDGHGVDVLSSQPSYKAALDNERLPSRDTLDGAQVTRLALPNEANRPFVRIFNALRLCSTVLLRAVILKRYDVIIISTSPPVLGGVAAALAARLTGARFVYHCMDIHPEVGRVSGEFGNPIVYQALLALDSWACRQAAPVVVLSEDMKRTLQARSGGAKLDIKVLNNFSLPSDDCLSSEAPPFELQKGVFTLLFAGNVGRFQGLDALIEAMIALRERSDIELIIMGDGTERERLEKQASDAGARVRFVGHHAVSVAKSAMKVVDAGFVSLVPDLYRFAYPSKTITYLEQGCPVLVAVEPESCLTQDIVENGLGMAVPPGDAVALSRAIAKLADNPEELRTKQGNAEAVGVERYSEAAVLPLWSKLLQTEVQK